VKGKFQNVKSLARAIPVVSNRVLKRSTVEPLKIEKRLKLCIKVEGGYLKGVS